MKPYTYHLRVFNYHSYMQLIIVVVYRRYYKKCLYSTISKSYLYYTAHVNYISEFGFRIHLLMRETWRNQMRLPESRTVLYGSVNVLKHHAPLTQLHQINRKILVDLLLECISAN